MSDGRTTHLGFIQNAITRMANEANTLKAWLVPVVTAAYGYASINNSWLVALLGVAATLVTGWQAARYLQQERAFRNLYDAAVKRHVDLFSMDTRPYRSPLLGRNSVLRSWSIWGFFGLFVLAGIAVAVMAALGYS